MVDFDTLVNGPCLDVFGDEVVFTAKGQLPVTVTGVFDRAFLQQQPFGGGAQEGQRTGAGGNVSAARPVLGVQLRQFPFGSPAKGDAIVLPKLLPGQAFTVQETRPDGKGWAMLLLTKSA